jgi:hypothetical protein
MRKNPLGVTALARVNGRGAYSARAASKGLSRKARIERARRLAKGGSMQKNARAKRARFMSMKKNPAARRSGKRLAAYNAARRRGMSKQSASRSALRRVPFTANERRKKVRFGGVKARMRRNRDSVAEQKKYEEGWERIYGGKKDEEKPKKRRASSKKSSKKGKKAVATPRKGKGKGKRGGRRKGKRTRKTWPQQHRKVKATRKVKKTVRAAVTRKQRVAYGPYRRARLFNPRTGRKEYSYYYRTKKGTYRRIPAWAVAGAKSQGDYKKSGFKAGGGPKAWERTQRARKRAADRVLKEGGVFTPNKGRRRGKKRSKYWAAYRRARAAGATKAEAKRVARGEKKMARRSRKKTGKRRKTRAGKRRTTKRTKRRAGGRRRLTKRQRAARKAARTRKRNLAARRAAAKKGARKRRGRKGAKRRARKTSGRRRARKTTRRTTKRSRKRGGRRMRKNRRRYAANRRGSYRRNKRKYRRNQGFVKTAKEVLKIGALVTAGFLTHRLVTSLVAEYGIGALTKPAEGEAASSWQLTVAKWAKPAAGLVVAGAGIAAVSMIKDEKTKVALGAGMVASWLQSTVVTILMSVEQPKIAAQFEGYSNSMAYQLRGNRRRRARSLRGMTSIMPRYAPVGALGAAPFMQAAAGTGEYFQANAVGEYFAPSSTQGVGAYEAAGPLAMQAAAGTGQVIEDGIRPDSDLDRVLDLAESAAGLGAARRRRGMGEYWTAQPDNSGFVESTVPTQSQWIPNGPLWAGTLGVKGNIESSELPAGILAAPGGNGVLSGG